MTSLIIHDIYHRSYITLVYNNGCYWPLPWPNAVLQRYNNIHFRQKSLFLEYWPTLRSFLRVKGSRYRKSEATYWKSPSQGLFKYRIKFAIALAVTDISVPKETPLLSDFWRFLAYFSYNWPTWNGPNFPKLTRKIVRNGIYLGLKFQVDISSVTLSIISKTSQKWRFFDVFLQFRPVFGQ